MIRLVTIVAITACVTTFATPPKVALIVASLALLTMVVLFHFVERRRHRLQEALGHAHSESARTGERVAAEREELTSQLEYWTTHDPLTRLANRTLFTRAVADALSGNESCGVMTISLAEFSGVNSTYGAAIGDQVLQAIAGRLQRVLRGADIAGRLGGDDFGVLLRGLEQANAEAAGNRLLRIFEDPVGVGEALVEVRARAGLAVTPAPQERVDALELIRRAEVAGAASTPSEGVNVFAPALQAIAAERNRLEADLRRALDAGEFVNHYQPLVSTVDGRVTSVEALVRWAHVSRGMVQPQEFITAAERCGLIVQLGLAVLQQACHQLIQWKQASDTTITIAVNLSARQLSEPGFVDSAKAVVWGAGVDPRQIMLEITESLLVEDSDAAIATLWQLRSLGFRLGVDDFGTGYSSLSRLSDLPIDEMKIDKSFVDRIGVSPNDSAPIISAAVAMGRALGLTVVAEGVETAEQAAFLRSVNCDLLQGYLLARPLDAAQVTPLLNEQLLDVGALAAGLPAQSQRDQKPFVPRILPSAEGPPTRRLFAR